MTDELKAETILPPRVEPEAEKKVLGWMDVAMVALVCAAFSGVVTYRLALNSVEASVQAEVQGLKVELAQTLAQAPRVAVFDTIKQTNAMTGLDENGDEFKRITRDLRSRQDELLNQGTVILDKRMVINAPDTAVLPILK
ncbi:MAG: hypothetical protein F8N36_16030 [Desulfovibrio sp.]|uniref:hypothetical protein n=1 Tax=Desulfovibrio sp. TaxID=885 RepID=UPI00135E6E05|nr:hypothetical protein [Desulfovibrio sp.]MTJ94348.1 hypothetical protein [Desulfovibrio sp.]